jgi:hypothetical protein
MCQVVGHFTCCNNQKSCVTMGFQTPSVFLMSVCACCVFFTSSSTSAGPPPARLHRHFSLHIPSLYVYLSSTTQCLTILCLCWCVCVVYVLQYPARMRLTRVVLPLPPFFSIFFLISSQTWKEGAQGGLMIEPVVGGGAWAPPPGLNIHPDATLHRCQKGRRFRAIASACTSWLLCSSYHAH